jgi:hypothetical protein
MKTGALRWLPRAVAAIFVALVLLGIGSPLVVRGPVLRWILTRASASRCGSFSVGGGHFGWASAIQLALRHPVSLTLHRLMVTDSEGKLVLKAERVEAAVRVRFSPVRIEVTEARIADGRWRLASSRGGRGMEDPFRPIPAGGREACRAPTPEANSAEQASPPKPHARVPGQVRIENARLEDIDIDLDFAAWQLELFGVTTTLWLSLDQDLQFGFRRAVAASGGTVRIGRLGSRGALKAPFDRVVFASFGTLPEAPGDLALVIEGARTGRSDLSGRATFHRVFPGAPAHAPPPGLEVAAKWATFGDGLSRLQAPWLPSLEWLKKIDGALQFAIHGPYNEPNATVAVQAPDAHVQAELAQGQFHLSLELSGADTSSWLAPELRPWLGGHLRGRLRASLRLASNFAGMMAETSYADLRLDREPSRSGPRTISLRVGPLQPGPSNPELLSLRIRHLGLMDGRLQISGARAAGNRLSAKLDASIAFDPSDWKGSRVEAHGSLAVCSLADWIPTRIVRGRLRLIGTLAGTTESLRLRAHFHPSSKLVVPKLRLGFPERLTATLVVNEAGVDAKFWVSPSLSGRLSLKFQPWQAEGEITLRHQDLQPWLSQLASLPPTTVSGFIRLNYRRGKSLLGLAALRVAGPGLEDVILTARSDDETISAWLSGRLALAPWRVFWSPYLATADGMLGFELRARHDREGSRVAGDLWVVRDLVLRSSKGYGPIRLLTGNKLSYEGFRFASPGLRIELPWFRGRITGRMTVNPSALSKSLIDAGVAGVLELEALPVKLPTGVTLRGQAAIEAAVSGSLDPTPGPQMHGQMNLDGIRIRLPGLPPLTLDGIVEAQGDRLTTPRLQLEMAPVGRITVGTPESPAWLGIVSLWPLQLGPVDARISGSNLVIGDPHAQIQIHDLDLDARLLGSPGARTLIGQVDLSKGTFRPSRPEQRSPSRGESRQHPWYRSLPSGLTVDLGIKGMHQALRIEVPSLPDVTVDLDCRLRATQQGAEWTGHVYGAAWYDRLALRLHSWLYGGGLRRCQFGTKN